MMSFSLPEYSNVEEEILTESENFTYEVEYKEIACDFYTRVCTYRNGELVSCTPWECGFRLDPVIISN